MKIILLVTSFLLCFSSAVAQSFGLTERDLRIVKTLADIAEERSSAVRSARRELEAAKQAEGFGQQLLNNTNISISGSSGNLASLPDGQVNPSITVSVSLNVTGLLKNEPSRIPELEAKLQEAESKIRTDVLNAYIQWWLASQKAEELALAVDTAIIEFRQTEARVKAGTATAADLAKARDNVSRANNDLRASNTKVVETKYTLIRICGITSADLERIIKETK
jgi:outer membrane protein TolC